ncbi:MAG TPA: hypothetical protein P5077_11985 [bacterium]|nr:hypothetical protein [bacterium]
MKKITFSLVVAILSFFLLSGCDLKGCLESCDENSDCLTQYNCYDVSGRGKVCIPDECGGCFSSDQTCYYYQDPGDSTSCTFTYCGY